MFSKTNTIAGLALLVLLLGLVIACGAAATATPTPSIKEQVQVGEGVEQEVTEEGAGATSTPAIKEQIQVGEEVGQEIAVAAPGIIDPTNRGWPRLVAGKNGVIEIKEKPQRVLSVSLGHDEILVALVDRSRIAALTAIASVPDFSNIADIAATIPGQVPTKDPEVIIPLDPDLVIADAFTLPETIELYQAAGLTVVQTEFDTSIGAIQDNIRLMAYMLGEVDRGERLVQQVNERLKFVTDTIGLVAAADKPKVVMLGYLSQWTGGTNTYNDDTITRAGGINLPSLEFEGFQEIGDESIVAMDPHILLLSANEIRDNDARNVFLDNPALSEVDAIKTGQVYSVQDTYLTTLSHWVVRGVEEVAKILHPDKFAGVEFPDFTFEVNVD